MLKTKKLKGDEKQVSAGRTPIPLKVGEKVEVVIRGGGVYEGGKAIDLERYRESGEKVETGELIKNAALVLCNPEDPSEEYTMSANVNTVEGRGIMAFLEKDNNGVYWLKEEMLNKRGEIGLMEKESKGGYEKKMVIVTWDNFGDAEGMPNEVSRVGADQREEAMSSGEAVI